jgi:hypothetical protein
MQKTYSIAGLDVRVRGDASPCVLDGIPGFRVFASDNSRAVDVDIRMDSAPAMPFSGARLLHRFTKIGIVHSFSSIEGGWLFEMRYADGKPVVAATHDPRTREVAISGCDDEICLKFALWVAFSLVATGIRRVPLHASAVVRDGGAVLFLGESGTGKSTHSRLWTRHIEGSYTLNDDSPIVRADGDGIFACGSPWSGKTHCYVPESAPVKAIVRLRQGRENKIRRLNPLASIGALYPSCPPLFAFDGCLSARMLDTVGRITGALPVYEMECRPDREAAEVAYNAIF